MDQPEVSRQSLSAFLDAHGFRCIHSVASQRAEAWLPKNVNALPFDQNPLVIHFQWIGAFDLVREIRIAIGGFQYFTINQSVGPYIKHIAPNKFIQLVSKDFAMLTQLGEELRRERTRVDLAVKLIAGDSL